MSRNIGYATPNAIAPLEFDRPEVGPGEIRTAIKYCGACHPDIHRARDEWKDSPRVGSEVRKYQAVDRVAVGCMIPAFIANDASIDGADLAIWHTFGPTHFPRPEEWPVMPVDYARFTLKAYGFFDRNPTLAGTADTVAHGRRSIDLVPGVSPKQSRCHSFGRSMQTKSEMVR